MVKSVLSAVHEKFVVTSEQMNDITRDGRNAARMRKQSKEIVNDCKKVPTLATQHADSNNMATPTAPTTTAPNSMPIDATICCETIPVKAPVTTLAIVPAKPPITGHTESSTAATFEAMQTMSTANVTKVATEHNTSGSKAPVPSPLVDDSTRLVADADICRGITQLMDSRDVNGPDVHVDDSNNNNTDNCSTKSDADAGAHGDDDVASFESNKNNATNSNSNKLVVDNTKRLDNHNSTATHWTEMEESESESESVSVPESKVLGVWTTGLSTEMTMVMTTATTTTTTTTTMTMIPAIESASTNGTGNHKINNYEIHQPHDHLVSPSPLDSTSWTSGEPAVPASDCQRIDDDRAGRQCELVSPRCQSRESNTSGPAADTRCPSNDSHCSGNDSATPAPTPTPSSPPLGLPLTATLPPAAAAALLPPQSAAMAAYFNAAAAAAQQNHLLLTNPLAAAASLVQQSTQSHSNAAALASSSATDEADASVLDFSTKRARRDCENGSDEDEVDEEKSDNDAVTDDANSPLDLSVSAGRKRQLSDDEPVISTRKNARGNDYGQLAPGTWVPPINPYLAAVAAANMSPKAPVSLDWNGKQRISPNEATKALEKMTEMTRLGSATEADVPLRQVSATSATNAVNSNGRHSAWQSHWLNKGADAVKDVFKCVWCKQSFPTLASLTTHMKETQHCGVNVPPAVATGVSTASNTIQATQASHNSRHSSTYSAANTSSSTAISTSSNKSDLNLLIKETMPLPRKLVRGQDVWLGKGAEQTRQILKCMWCGQSFRSLAEMTSHMQETQHYTNIISQEQIISWKSSDDKSSSGGSSNGAATSPAVTSPPSAAVSGAMTTVTNASTSSATVSAVLTCKVCDQAFSSLKDLSNHMVKNSHYKEHMMRSAGDNNSSQNIPRRGRQTREKRKKSLPVRKLLELERAQQDFKSNNLDPALKPLRDFAASTKITCEKCGDKIETALFVDHIRQCLGGTIPIPARNSHLKSPYATPVGIERLKSPQTPSNRSDGRKTAENNLSPISSRPNILCPLPKEGDKSSSSPSVLNAIEQLIEKSFDTRSRQNNAFGGSGQTNTPLGSSILKRLGIDDSVDYTKPLLDPQTMHFLRSYSSYSGRDRSVSESSSVSERCSSRLESVTPDRNSELSRQATPCLTPDKIPQVNEGNYLRKESTGSVKVKSEPADGVESQGSESHAIEHRQKISVKKEFTMDDDDDACIDKATTLAHNIRRKSLTPISRAISPSTSERSITPKSTSSISDKKLAPAGGSLNALSSMFDNLNSMNSCAISNASNVETNNNNTTGKKSNANPLAALQKLCETTDPPAGNTRTTASTLSHHGAHAVATTNGGGAGGSMVAFSWACNDAVMTSDLIIKCSFCDTPFCSKGAYRHHLSKVHFVKDDADSQSSNAMKSPAPSPKLMPSPKSASKSPASYRQAASPSNMMTPPTINPYDESPQSKFLKYTELAKQLSSKNV